MIAQLFAITAPVFFGAAFGYGWAKMNKPFDPEFVTSFVFFLGTPFLVFSTLTKLDSDPKMFADIALVVISILALFFVISAIVIKLGNLDFKTFLPAVMIPNTGNIGLPLAFFAFGEQGLAFAIMVYTIVAFTQFTLGLAVASGQFSLTEFAKNPLFYAIIAALFVMITKVPVPEWIANTTELFGQFAIPLTLVSLGVSLSKIKITSFGRNIVLTLVRFSMGLGVSFIVTGWFDLEGMVRGVIILQSAMPVAIFNYMFAMRYKNSPEEVAGLVVTSTLFAFITLPILLVFVLKLAG